MSNGDEGNGTQADDSGALYCSLCESRQAVIGSLCVPCLRASAEQLKPHGPTPPASMAQPTAIAEHTTRQVIIDVPRLSAELTELQSRIRSALALVTIRPAERITPRDFFAAQAMSAIMVAVAAAGSASITIGTTYINCASPDASSLSMAAYEWADGMVQQKATADGTGES